MVAEAIVRIVLSHWPSLVGLTLIGFLIHQRYQKGLNKYPGPLLASFTNWWRLWDVYKRRPELTHIRLHRQLGDVVRLGPNYLSFGDPKALKSIYGLNKGFVKSDFYIVQQATSSGHRLPSLFSTVSEPFHAALRRCVSSAFSMSTLIQYETFVDSTSRVFLSQTEKLFAQTNQTCDFAEWLQFYAFDVIGDITYSKRHGFLDDNRDVDGIIGYLSWLFSYVAPIGQIPVLDLIFQKNPIILLASRYGLLNTTSPIAKFAISCMSERYPRSHTGEFILPQSNDQPQFKGKPDLLSKFVQANIDRPDFMDASKVMTMAVSMAFAGSETTAISLSSVFYYLVRNPACLARLLNELGNAEFHDVEDGLVTWSESQKLEYLDAVVKESFRMHPAAGLPLERIVPPAGAEIAGHHIPGGTTVGCSAWIIHRRPEVFGEDVDIYRPDRWLVDQTKDVERERERIKEMNATMFHFGMGPRTCIGKNISLLEIYKLVPSFLRRFEIELEDPTQEWKLHNAWFVKQLNFRTKFKRRNTILGRAAAAAA